MLHFIVNGKGGSGKAAKTWEKVRRILEREGVDYLTHETTRPGEATQIVRGLTGGDAAEESVKLVVVGGDGTVNEVLNGVDDFSRFSLGLVPTGSGNDFARGLGIPKSTGRAMGLILSSAEGKLIDIGRAVTEINPRGTYFGISAGIGMDAIVCKKAGNSSRLKKFLNKLRLGQLTYIILTVKTLFSMTTETVSLRFDGGDEEHQENLIFLAGMNVKTEGGGVCMAPGADTQDGRLSLCMASGIPRWKTFLDLPFLVKGKHARLKGFALRDFKTLEVSCENPVVLHCDGEYNGDVRHIKFECVPGTLRMML